MASQQAQERINGIFDTGLDRTVGGTTVSLTFNTGMKDVSFIDYNGTDDFTTIVGGGGGGGGYRNDNTDDGNNNSNKGNTNNPGNDSNKVHIGITATPTHISYEQRELIDIGLPSSSETVDSTIVMGYEKENDNQSENISTSTASKNTNPCSNHPITESDKSDSEIVENMNSLINVSPDVVELAKELYAYSDFKDKPVAEIIDKGISRSTSFYEEYNLSAQRIFLDQTRETKYVSSKTKQVVLNSKVEEYNGVNLFYLTQGKRFASVNTTFSTKTCIVIDLAENTTNKDRTVRVTLVNRSNVKLQEFIITQKRNELKHIIETEGYIQFTPIKQEIINPNLTAFVFVDKMEFTQARDAIKISFVTSGFEDIFKTIFFGTGDKIDKEKFNKYMEFYSGENVLVVENYDECGKNGDFEKQTKPKFCWSDIGLYSITDNLSYDAISFRAYTDEDVKPEPGQPIKIPFLSEHMYLRLKHNGKFVSSITIPINPNRKFNRYYNKIKKNSTDWKFNCKFSLSFRNKNRGYQPLTQIQFVQQNKYASSVLQPATLSGDVKNNNMKFSYIDKEVIIETIDG